MTDYLARELAPRLTQALRRLPVVVLSGPRQVGKSTLLLNDPLLSRRTYRTLDEFAVLAAMQRDPEQALADIADLTLDEVQKCPELLVAIKLAVDRQRQAGRFLLSGSANLALMAKVTESLAGRAVYLTLHPMSRRERNGRTRMAPALVRFLQTGQWPAMEVAPVQPEEIVLGGLPPVCLGRAEDAAEWFQGYEQTYVERDVRQLAQITDLISFRTLSQLAALRTGQVLNVSVLGRDAKLSAATTSRYLHLLEALFLLRRLPPFLRNRSSRLIKSPKLFLTDSGLACHLAGVRDLSAVADEPLRGPLFETYVVQNVAAILESHLPEAQLGYWHEQGRHEVDLVIESGRQVVALEIKAASRWSQGDLTGLRAFLDRTPQCQAGLLAYNGKQTVPLGPKLWAVPLGVLLE
jgi:uncharacterized protein